MSVPCMEFVCNRCDFKAISDVLSGPHSYRINDLDICVDRELGWCMQCQTLVGIERFNVDSQLAKLRWVESMIARHNASCWRRLMHPEQLAKLIRHLEKVTLTLELIERRRGTEKCLRCSSEEVIPFAPKENGLKVERFRYHGVRTATFLHPGCGGTLIAQPHPIRYHWRFYHRIYDGDGRFLGEEDCN